MSILVKGYATRKLFPKNTTLDSSFKIYAFVPSAKTDELALNEYGNITIKGEIPSLLPNKEYEIEVEYEYKNGRSSYNVERILTQMNDTVGDAAFTFLCEITSATRAETLLEVYPDIIDRLRNDGDIDVKLLKGIGQKTLNTIRDKVMAQFVYYDLIAEYRHFGVTMNQIKKLMAAYKSVQNVKEKMNINPYICLCSIAGIGFKTADEKILRINPKFLQSTYRMSEAIQYVLGQNEVNGNTYINTDDLYPQCKELVPEAIHLYHRALEKSNRVYYRKDTGHVAKLSTRLCEMEVAYMLNEINDKNFPVIDEDFDVVKTKPTWKDSDGNEIDSSNIDDKYKFVDGFALTEEQQKVIPAVIDNNVVILAGYGGSGKSFSTKALINWLEDNHKSYQLLAPTGRAASVLANYTERQTSTIHRALESKGEGFFEKNKDNKLFASIIIVDEATMIDIFLMKALLDAVPNYCKILFICDPAQLASVGPGNAIQDMIRSKKFKTILLDKVFRYGEGGLSYVATKARKGESFLNTDEVQVFGKNEDYIFEEKDNEGSVNAAIKKYVELYKNGTSVNDMVIISCYNKGAYGTLQINNIVQKIINPPKEKNDGKVGYTKEGISISFNVGDRIMQTQNNYHVHKVNGTDEYDDECVLYNGDFGVVEKITDSNELICMFGENQVKIPKQEVSSLLLGYSVSCHKMQGDSRPYVMYVSPKAHTFMANRNLHYVALTRAKQKLYHYGDRQMIKKSLLKSENLSRKTFLESLLREYDREELVTPEEAKYSKKLKISVDK